MNFRIKPILLIFLNNYFQVVKQSNVTCLYNAMNRTECIDLESVKWTDAGNIISLAVLAFMNVLVIVGNCLVIAAVFCSHKLRSVTNFFIVSLAVADLFVGLAVLPFSATWEVFKVSV